MGKTGLKPCICGKIPKIVATCEDLRSACFEIRCECGIMLGGHDFDFGVHYGGLNDIIDAWNKLRGGLFEEEGVAMTNTNFHECNSLETIHSITIQKIHGRWLWVFWDDKKGNVAHEISYCPYCGKSLHETDQ